MTIREIITAIPELTGARYEFAEPEGFIQKILALRPSSLEQNHVMRLRRSIGQTDSWRTVLAIEIYDINGVIDGISWAASVRDELLNSESADLYLFVITNNSEVFPLETCINIEAGDQYCRKYITRPDETISDFMNRTFLCKFDTTEQLQSVTDPLKLALLKTNETFAVFDESTQAIWRDAFLSGRTGLELADILFSDELQAE